MTFFKKVYIVLTVILIFFSIKVFSQFDIHFNKGYYENDTSNRGNISFLYNQIKYDTVLLANKSEFIGKLKHLEINSGTIYFSGTGFPVVASTTYKGRLSALSSFFTRCVAGSKVTFEKCTFKNDDGTISKLLNKSIFFK